MTAPRQLDLEIIQGATFIHVERLALESLPLVYKAITAVTKAAPVAITATSHLLKTGWRCAVVSVGGMRQLKATNWPLRSTDFHQATVTDANIITLNDVNSTDYTTYTSGGSLVYYTPTSLASCTARMSMRDTVEATTALDEFASGAELVLDDTEHTITLTIPASVTAAYDWTNGVYDLELVTTGGVVTRLLYGNVVVTPEVTR